MSQPLRMRRNSHRYTWHALWKRRGRKSQGEKDAQAKIESRLFS